MASRPPRLATITTDRFADQLATMTDILADQLTPRSLTFPLMHYNPTTPEVAAAYARSSSNARWSAFTASSTCRSSMMQVIRISLVVIMSMFTFSAANARNIVAA